MCWGPEPGFLCTQQLLQWFAAMFGENLPSWFTIPRNLRSSETDFGVSICFMAAVLLGSAVMPLSSLTCPRNIRLVLQNSHFLLLSVKPAEERRFSTAWSRLLCSCLVVPKMRMSSIMQSTPGKPSRSEYILH